MTEVKPPLSFGHILTGPFFNEPMRVETVQSTGAASWIVGLLGTNSERFRNVTITAEESGALNGSRPAALLRRRRPIASPGPPSLRPRHCLRVRSVFRALDFA